MKFPLRSVLVLTAVIVAAFLVLAVACGGGEKESPKASPTTTAAKTPTATAAKTPAAGETPEKTPAGGAGEAPNIAAYPGATEVFTGTFDTGGTFPFPLSEDMPVNPEDFGNVQYTLYQTNDSSQNVLDFYKKELKDWKQEGSFEVGGMTGEIMMWSRDDGKDIVWLAAFDEGGGTSVVVATGVHQ
ncbi:MAG: hypothetical protein MUP14_01770 [Dehalococcoidia bacterium]|nr:hypothetical protein [Dehalococcoidia bacterium]